MPTHDIRIALDGIVSLLSRNLYSSPDAFVRELVQNAHDSIVRRRSVEPEHEGSIRIVPDETSKTLTFIDDGLGLTAPEIHDYLATIGRSGTNEFKERLSASGLGDAARLIGQFGIGLLSAFLVARRVEVRTRAHGSDEAWHWVFDGGSRYELNAVERPEVGTSVELHLDEAHAGYLERGRIEELVRRYADFLDVAIVVGSDARPINATRPPWDAEVDLSDSTARTFFERRFPETQPLLILPLSAQIPGGTVRGVLGIPRRSVALARGRVDLYVRRMFIAAQQPGLMPPWATFFDGVVQCDQLTPTAARDAVLQDDVLQHAQSAIGAAIIEALHDMVASDRTTLVGVLRVHSSAILGLCVQNERVFDALADLVPLRTSRGPLCLPELLEENGNPRIYVLNQVEGASPLRTLCAARGRLVVELTEPYAEAFVRRYAERWPSRLEVAWLDSEGAAELLEPLGAEEKLRFRKLVTRAGRMCTDHVEVARFLPSALPALRLETRRGRGRRTVRELVDDVGLPDFLRDALGDVTASASRDEAVVYLNASNPLVEVLRDAEDDERSHAVLNALLDQARLFSGARLSQSEREDVYQRICEALSLVLLPP